MKTFLWLLTVLILMAGCKNNPKVGSGNTVSAGLTTASSTDSSKIVRDGVFIHISAGYENPHKALMPLKMALMMSTDKDVAIYLDLEAVKLVLKDSRDMAYQDFPNLKELLSQLISKKILIMACPTCLKVAGKSESDLMAGVIPADKEKFFSFTKGKISTLDY